MKNHNKILFIFLLFSFSIFFISCGRSGGTKGLNQQNVGSIVEGKSTYKDVLKMYGYPKAMVNERQMFIFDNKELKSYLYSYTKKKYDFPEGEYEVWRYWWYYSGADITSIQKRRDLIIVFNDKGIVIKKLFSNVSERSGIFPDEPQPDFK